MTNKPIPEQENKAGDYKMFASAMILQTLHDALYLLVPMHAEEYVRKMMPFVAYQKGNPNSDIIPWSREVTDARHWFLNDAYDRWLVTQAGPKDPIPATLSWCADQLGKSAEDIRLMAQRAIKQAEDAESMWLPTDLDKVRSRILAVKKEMETKLKYN